ncbi:D-lactate dehydrogenase domain protein [Clostridioides difficile 6041]|nr:D-lactate dehydrogenase domain protein [Clostridioides difficile]EQG06641.1 D-lactate dehydrogenase domain protein [Clostridioides difficile 6041]
MEQVIFTHHLGFFTSTAIENIVYSSLSSAVEVIKTGTATNRVN